MSRPTLIVHALLAVIWIPLAVVLGLKIALLGNEKATLAKLRGADFKARTDLAFAQERMRSQLDYVASPPALEAAVKRLELKIGRQDARQDLRPPDAPSGTQPNTRTAAR